MRNKSYDEKMRAALREAWRREQEQLNKEVEDMGPHVFSEEFNQKMDKLLNEMAVKEKRGRRKDFIIRACAIVATFVLLVTGATTFATVNARASASGMNVIEWCEKYFVTRVAPNKSSEATLFDESRITYIPEGFEKVLEEKEVLKTSFRFENKDNDYIALYVYGKDVLSGYDSENIEQTVNVNEGGFEYRFILTDTNKENAVIWYDNKGVTYVVIGAFDKEEIINFMNGITY